MKSMQTFKRIGGGIVILISMLFLSCALFESGTEEEYDFEEIARVRKILAERKWIIHAGGLIQDESGTEYSYTNSFDALNQCFALGNTVSEIDFRITSDNCLVCTHASEYDEIRAFGFKNIIYTLYATTEKERDVQTLINFAKKHELLGFTYWYYWTPTYFAPFKNANISQYLHTVNNTTERNSYLQQGISAIYTDVVKN